LIFGFAGSAVAGKAADPTLHLVHDWQVSLGADGKVVQLQDDGELAPSVRESLEREIRGWTFEPGRVDGRPAPTETALTLDISFVPAPDDRYAVRIDGARTGGSLRAPSVRKAHPRMPRDAMKPGLVAMIVVKANYDASGAIVSVEPQPEYSVNAMRSLEKATIAAVKQWAVAPERVGGRAVPASLMLPVCYTVTTSSRNPPDFACTFTPQGSRSKIAEGGAFALEPAARLSSDVIGRTL
jgi:hypothetical protein